MSFYCFTQCNNGGIIYEIIDKGIAEHTIIEADSAEQANDIALNRLDMDIYDAGAGDWLRCVCCDPRWEPVTENNLIDLNSEKFSKNESVAVKYLDGSVTWLQPPNYL